VIVARARAILGLGRPPRTVRLAAPVWLTVMALAVILLAIGRSSVLRASGGFLVVDEALEPAEAIVALAGQSPERESEAAALYHAGWAPSIVIVAGSETSGLTADDRQEILLRLGVPEQAIVKVDERARNTREELELAASVVPASEGTVILVTSKYHARRVQLTWDRATGGHRSGLVRIAPLDPFDPDGWWDDPRQRGLVVHEYLGLLQLLATWPT
jgi:uncharacterized SAM-binding protein YcdF (DUF218 family)